MAWGLNVFLLAQRELGILSVSKKCVNDNMEGEVVHSWCIHLSFDLFLMIRAPLLYYRVTITRKTTPDVHARVPLMDTSYPVPPDRIIDRWLWKSQETWWKCMSLIYGWPWPTSHPTWTIASRQMMGAAVMLSSSSNTWVDYHTTSVAVPLWLHFIGIFLFW